MESRQEPEAWQQPATGPDLTVSDLVAVLNGWLRRLLPGDGRIGRLADELTRRHGGRTGPVTAAACREIEATAWRHSRHLNLWFDPDGAGVPDDEPPGWPDPDPRDVRTRAGGVTSVDRRPDGVCVVRIDALEPAALALPYLDAAFALAAGSAGLVLDLRGNGGGDPATVAWIAGRLLGEEPAHLSDVTGREGRRQWWTPPLPAGTALPAGLPVAVAVGPGTFSSAEALAYHLRARGRVTVVGEPTPGAADHVTPIRLAATVTSHLPEAYVTDAVTGANWEGTGVAPDVGCGVADAVEVAAGCCLR